MAVDKSGPDRRTSSPSVNGIVAEMHADGTLKAFSEKWFGADLTVDPAADVAPDPTRSGASDRAPPLRSLEGGDDSASR